jgi:hypothetical protein
VERESEDIRGQDWWKKRESERIHQGPRVEERANKSGAKIGGRRERAKTSGAKIGGRRKSE